MPRSGRVHVEVTAKLVNSVPDTFDAMVEAELRAARSAFPTPFNSAHEGFGILLEEMHELWDEVRAKQGVRDHDLMLEEVVQVAAMAQRFAEDIIFARRAQL